MKCYIADPNYNNIGWYDCIWTRKSENNRACWAIFKRKEPENKDQAVQCYNREETVRQKDGEDETWKLSVNTVTIAEKARQLCILEIAADKSWKVGKAHDYTDWSCTLQQCKNCCQYNETCHQGNGQFASDTVTIGVSEPKSNLKNRNINQSI